VQNPCIKVTIDNMVIKIYITFTNDKKENNGRNYISTIEFEFTN